MELPPLWKRHCSKKPLTILTEMQVFPEKENSFVTKATVPLFCLHYKQAPKMACVTQTFPKQSALHSNTRVTVCAADSPVTNTGYVRKVYYGVQV